MPDIALSRRSFFAMAATAVAAPRFSAAQQTPTFSTEIKVVNVFATVRDKQGQMVRDLDKQDFEIREDGKPQTIRYFSRDSDLPLTIALLVDSSLSQGRVLDDELSASYRFLNSVLREREDKGAVVQFDQAVVIRQNLTSSHKDLKDVLTLVDLPNMKMPGAGGGTLLYNAVRQASVQLMRMQQGRKAFIVLTDGNDFGSNVTLEDAIESAQRAATLVYCILFSDESYYGGFGGAGGKGVLQKLARESGGGFFAVTKEQGIDAIFKTIEDELRSEYSIGFVSDQPLTHSGFRTLKLINKRKGLIVQATDRYYAET
ncbi:MAG: VWA domain-containing protein [Acidobacteriaceae bacterium]|nr:VWA domain-containing protein [Acidobacteriaceae bacterium]